MKRLTKSSTDKKLAGVCGGIAEYFDIDSTIIRIGLILFCCMGGSGFLAYVLAACIMPEDTYGDY